MSSIGAIGDALIRQPATLLQPPQAFQPNHFRLLDDRRDGRAGVTEVTEYQAVTAMDQGQMMAVHRFRVVENCLLNTIVGTQDQPVPGTQTQKSTNLAEVGSGIDNERNCRP
jgi:hypothetical protein